MRKKKDGTIIASLTEVKNKTGDIFSLVDEYGEVVLTSYNKPKYKISKMSVGGMLEVEEEVTKKKVQEEPKKSSVSGIKRVAETVKNITKKTEPVVDEMKNEKTSVTEEPKMISSTLLEALKNMKVWERNSKAELKYIKAILTPLQ